MTRIRAAGLLVAAITVAVAGLAPIRAAAQTGPGEAGAEIPAYKPPPRGAPGGRVGGASRGTVKAAAPLPKIDLLAPRDHAGLTLSPIPSLYFFVSGPVAWPMRLTISAPLRPSPVLEIAIPSPRAAGIYRLDLGAYPVRLQRGVIYTWSVSAILDPAAPARDVVASASLLVVAPDPAVMAAAGAPPAHRAALFAHAGLWYDAIASAAEAEGLDRHAALDALMAEVGLVEPVRYDRRGAAAGAR